MKKVLVMAALGGIVLSSCNKAPEVAFTADKATVKMNESVTFTNSTPEKKGYDFQWSFGDGGSASTFNASHAYAESGAYTVTLTGANKKGNQFGTATTAITVSKEDANMSDAQNAYNATQDAFDSKMKALRSAMVGTWNVTTVTRNDVYCDGNTNDGIITGNADALKSKIMVVEDGSMIFYDHNGNASQGSWNLIDDTHIELNISSWDWPISVNSTSGFESKFQLENGVYSFAAGASITFTRVETMSSASSGKPCDNVTTCKLTVTKG